MTDRIFLALKTKVFNNFKNTIELKYYCEMVEKFINFDPDSCKEFLFAIFDLNNDK